MFKIMEKRLSIQITSFILEQRFVKQHFKACAISDSVNDTKYHALLQMRFSWLITVSMTGNNNDK